MSGGTIITHFIQKTALWRQRKQHWINSNFKTRMKSMMGHPLKKARKMQRNHTSKWIPYLIYKKSFSWKRHNQRSKETIKYKGCIIYLQETYEISRKQDKYTVYNLLDITNQCLARVVKHISNVVWCKAESNFCRNSLSIRIWLANKIEVSLSFWLSDNFVTITWYDHQDDSRIKL